MCTVLQGQFERSHSWLLQPSYEVQHLLLTQNDDSPKGVNVDLSHLHSPSYEIIWRMANKFYFKNIASFKILEKICLNFHKDLQLIEVCLGKCSLLLELVFVNSCQFKNIASF